MACRFTELIVDAADPPRLARWWSEVLGYEITGNEPKWAEIKGPEGSGPAIAFVKLPDKKTVKNRLHIDVNPTDRSQEEEVERIVALGATRVDIGQRDVSWVVLADPEGNEFCVLRRRVPKKG